MVIFHSYVKLPEGKHSTYFYLLLILRLLRLLVSAKAALGPGRIHGNERGQREQGQTVRLGRQFFHRPGGDGSKPCTPVVHIKIAGIYGCSSH